MKKEDFLSRPVAKKLITMINIARWIIIGIGFLSALYLNHQYVIEINNIIPEKYNIIIPIIIIIINISLTVFSYSIEQTSAVTIILIIMEVINLGLVILLYGTQFILFILIPIMEIILFFENSWIFIMAIIAIILISLTGLKEIFIDLDKIMPIFKGLESEVKPGAKGTIKLLMMFSLISFIAVNILVTWLFKNFIDEHKNQGKSGKNIEEEKAKFEEELKELGDSKDNIEHEIFDLQEQILKSREELEKSQELLTRKSSIINFINEISSCENLEELLDITLNNIEKIIQCQSVCIYLKEEINKNKKFVLKKASGPYGDTLENSINPGEDLIGWVGEKGQALLTGNGAFYTADNNILPPLIKQEQSALVVPLIYHHNVTGILYTGDAKSDTINQEAKDILIIVASILANIINGLDISREDIKSFKEKEKELSGTIENLESIMEELKGLFETMDFEIIIDRLINVIINSINCKTCLIFLERKHIGETLLEAVGLYGPYSEYFKTYKIKSTETIIGYVYRNKKELLVKEGLYRIHQGEEQSEFKLLHKYDKSAIILPVKKGKKVLGVLYISHPELNAYSSQEKNLLSIMNHYGSLAINNILEYQKSLNTGITDELTGLENRMYFSRRLEEEMARSIRFGFGFAITLIDIDKFKELNKTHGTEAGDYLLKEIASVLRYYSREADCVARIEDDLFGIIFMNITKHNAVLTTERLRAVIEKRTFGEELGEGIKLTVSMGISVYPDDGKDTQLLLEQALASLEEAIKQGGNRAFFMA